ncbi:uncharacterized protein AMSG_12243 [Thecamonas trahens ATCC 50062]|uniref:VCBS repeat-containing protein n=1 Tax=Thecamonas trahens ATCC 50062 TaxID=461836 RepID=A0A0L0DNL1_THETB|nr:hypothetical protein AMSG_12243 [Thecamonas trahens ATCC 50062]KNC53008.1 hypothetical protein AMSG_12243 [Thecamonas trahens ATCC 50062]|eukprot:XP_013754921.1 hypothetical protein AMSG_12243 [Thecamonas trahens ATCC 50062]
MELTIHVWHACMWRTGGLHSRGRPLPAWREEVGRGAAARTAVLGTVFLVFLLAASVRARMVPDIPQCVAEMDAVTHVVTSLDDGPIDVVAADVDGDGWLDLVYAAHNAHKIGWYRYNHIVGGFEGQQVVSTAALGVQSVIAADIDGDSDLDLASASANDNKIAWYENINGAGSFGPQQVVSTAAGRAQSVIAADMDGDGDLDLASASATDNKIAWYENIDGVGTFGPQQVVSTTANSARSVVAADVDGDGDMDLVSASSSDNKIAWYENTDGVGSFGPQQVVSIAASGAQSVIAADMDGDGDLDLASASVSDNKIAWYENIDGAGRFGPPKVVSTTASYAQCVVAADIDGDGDLDLASASYYDNKIAWYENTDGAGTFGPPQVVSSAAKGASSVIAADMDRDSDLDLASALFSDREIAWYENTDGAGSFGSQQVVSTTASYARCVVAADVDGDGDLDLASASVSDNKIAWYENIDGVGSFGPQQVVSTAAHGVQSVIATDVDGDGDLDLASASASDNKIAWYENIDGAGSFGPQQVVSTTASYARCVVAADVDGDGDLDLASASSSDNKIAWYENIDGAGSRLANLAANSDRTLNMLSHSLEAIRARTRATAMPSSHPRPLVLSPRAAADDVARRLWEEVDDAFPLPASRTLVATCAASDEIGVSTAEESLDSPDDPAAKLDFHVARLRAAGGDPRKWNAAIDALQLDLSPALAQLVETNRSLQARVDSAFSRSRSLVFADSDDEERNERDERQLAHLRKQAAGPDDLGWIAEQVSSLDADFALVLAALPPPESGSESDDNSS